jgi:hypothetical protein
MSKIWFCRNCGYEVSSRGRCHACKARLSPSPLPELAAGNEDDEVIVRLIEAHVVHRFDDDELVVAADDEQRTDDLVEEVALASADDEEEGEEVDDPVLAAADEALIAQVQGLLASGRRLREDPTDMQADSDLAHASATVFIAEEFFGTDAETWAAVGRVTRRLLGALGADEALEDEIRLQAGILVKLLEPLVGAEGTELVADSGDGEDLVTATGPGGETGAVGDPEVESETGVESVAGESGVVERPEVAGDAPGDGPQVERGRSADGPPAGESVYELPEWLPEQRAQLSLLLDEASIAHVWEGGDLVVALAVEAEVEALFDRVDGVEDDEDDEARYRALEALFDAADRFVNDPDSRTKRAAVVTAVINADGPTPVGLDDAQWWSIRSRARTLADSIDHDASLDIIFEQATTLRDLLRVLV